MAVPIGCLEFIKSSVANKLLHPAYIRRIGNHLVSGIGVGAYKVGGEHGKTHFDTISKALSSGAINMVETSTHYGLNAPGEAEEMVGAALKHVQANSAVRRDQIVVVTKIGHIERPRLEYLKTHCATERGTRGTSSLSNADPNSINDFSSLYEDLVPPARKPSHFNSLDAEVQKEMMAKDVFHCLSPEFILDEFEKSSARLRTKPDYLFLHNPEFYLSHALTDKGLALGDAWGEMYHRLESAFATLEALTQAGEISGYGVSGNFLNCYYSVTGKSNVYEALELQRLLGSVADAVEKKTTLATLGRSRDRNDNLSADAQSKLQVATLGSPEDRNNNLSAAVHTVFQDAADKELLGEITKHNPDILSEHETFFAANTGLVGVQAPLNLLEFGAVKGRRDVVSGHEGEPETDILRRNNLAFIANRPLTAIPPPGLKVATAGNPDWESENKNFIEFRDPPKGRPQGTLQRLVANIVHEELNRTPSASGATDASTSALPLQQVALQCALSPGAIVLNGMRAEAHVEDALAVLQSAPLVPGDVSDGENTVVGRIAERLQSVCEELGANCSGLWKR